MQAKLKKVLLLFIMIQPLLDIFYWYVPPVSKMLPFAVPTIIRIILVFILFIMFLKSYRLRDQKWWVYTYIATLGVYFVLHIWNATHFTSVVPGNFNFSIMGELFYFVRMVLPLFILYLTAKTDITEQNLQTVVQTLVGSVSGTIVATNILMISLTSYSNNLIKGNIFNWFMERKYFSFFDLASKGLFYFANTTSAVLLMLTPLMWYFVIKKTNFLNVSLISLLMFSMFMLGTKVAALGFMGVSLAFFMFVLFHRFVLKNVSLPKNGFFVFLVIIAISAALYPVSPSHSRTTFDDSISIDRESEESKSAEEKLNEKLEKQLEGKTEAERKEILSKFIKKHYDDYYLAKNFVMKKYPYKYDPEFWYGVMKWPATERSQYRVLEKEMLTRILNYNNRKADKFLGITYSRMNNLFNLERDFYSQSFSMGYIGMVLLLGAYVIVFLYAGILWLLKNKYKTLLNTALLIGIGVILLTASYSGNVMDFLFATFILAFLEGTLLHFIDKIKNDDTSSQKEVDNLA